MEPLALGRLVCMKGHDCSDSSAMSALISQLIKHQPMNITKQNVIAIEARADADDQKNVELAPNP